MRRPSPWLLWILVATACKGDPARPDARLDAEDPIDAFDPPWWTPKPGEAANWDIQLADPLMVAEPRTMYDVDLWQVTPATTITYADSSTVAVPAGAHPTAIATIHALSPRPVVICHLRVGSINLMTDPDRMKFPGFKAAPPDSPNAPEAGSVIGWSSGLPTGERWLDLRSATRGAWAELLEKRIQLAKDIGCDGVDVDRAVQGASGFGDPQLADLKSFSVAVADLVHARELSAGTRATTFALPDELDTVYDWILLDRCVDLMECDAGRPFSNLDKAVLAVGYPDELANPCDEWPRTMVKDGIIKHDPPAGDFRMTCP